MKRKVQGLKCKSFTFLTVVFTFAFLLFTFPYPAYADVPIKDKFGFGDITSFGQATKPLVGPIFSIAAFLVILYFLLGAFKYLRGGGNKEEAAEARQMISHAIVGFIILMFAFLILQFVIFKLFNIEFSIIG